MCGGGGGGGSVVVVGGGCCCGSTDSRQHLSRAGVVGVLLPTVVGVVVDSSSLFMYMSSFDMDEMTELSVAVSSSPKR